MANLHDHCGCGKVVKFSSLKMIINMTGMGTFSKLDLALHLIFLNKTIYLYNTGRLDKS